MKKYQFHYDNGHGWLKVPKIECEGLKVSRYSYTDGDNYYLEEDCDMADFIYRKESDKSRQQNWFKENVTEIDDTLNPKYNELGESFIRSLDHIL